MRTTCNAVVSLIFTAMANAAGAQQLVATSTGYDWLSADSGQRSAWSQQIARLFNKEDAFGEAVEACLSELLANQDNRDDAMLEEARHGDLPMLTAGCVLSIQPADIPSH